MLDHVEGCEDCYYNPQCRECGKCLSHCKCDEPAVVPKRSDKIDSNSRGENYDG